MASNEKLIAIRRKVERAEEHFGYLTVAVAEYLKTDPYAFGTKHNPETGQDEVYALRDITEAPPEMSLMVGDIVHNLRSALDHLAYQLVLDGTEPPDRTTSFPITNTTDPVQYEANRRRKIKGVVQAVIDAIDATEPYQGGKGDALWVLSELDNIDKHRTLLIADVRLAKFYLSPTQYITHPSGRREFVLGAITVPGFQAPLKAGDVLFTIDPAMYKDVNFTFTIAFTEPEAVKGQPVLPTLQNLIELVDNLILGFQPLLN